MSEHNDYIDATLVESYRIIESDIPEPLENWSLEDFADVIQARA